MRIVLFGLVTGLMPAVGHPQDAEEFIAVRQLATHIMQVSADTLGTGVSIDSHLAVTNCHVIGTAQRMKVTRGV